MAGKKQRNGSNRKTLVEEVFDLDIAVENLEVQVRNLGKAIMVLRSRIEKLEKSG